MSEKIGPTLWRGEQSKNSLSFFPGVNRPGASCFSELFEIEDRNRFHKLFDEACSGDGSEGARIATLHSSALCALLFFHSVGTHPLRIELDGKQCIFHKVNFEIKNKVFANGKPSNIDVVLTGETTEKDVKVILYLESKFAEYYLYAKTTTKPYSAKYMDDPTINLGGLMGLYDGVSIVNNQSQEIVFRSTNPCYLEGIKQMLAHYIGISNDVDKHECEKKIQFYLGEILFDHGINNLELPKESGSVSALVDYSEKYKLFAKHVESLQAKRKLQILPKVLTYNELFQEKNQNFLLPKIKAFYFGESDS